jgi:hypothetical protein
MQLATSCLSATGIGQLLRRALMTGLGVFARLAHAEHTKKAEPGRNPALLCCIRWL